MTISPVSTMRRAIAEGNIDDNEKSGENRADADNNVERREIAVNLVLRIKIRIFPEGLALV